MYAMYVTISVILLLIGTVSSVYFVRFLKNRNLQHITVPALSESLNTLFIGIFYLYCAVIMSQHIINYPPPTINDDGDIMIIEEPPEKVTEYYDEKITTESTEKIGDTTPVFSNSQFPNQQFLINYHTFLKNAIKKKTAQKQKEVEKNEAREDKNDENTNTTDFRPKEKCFEEIFMENSMFLYSFLHSAISLIIGTIKVSSDSKDSDPESQKPPKSEGSDEVKLDTNRSSKTQSSKQSSKQSVAWIRMNLVLKIFVIFLVPVISIVIFYFVLDQDMQSNLDTKMLDPDTIDSNIWNIIHKPINVSTSEKKQEINDIVNNIYTIVNETRKTTPNIEMYDFNTRRRPKQLETCPNFNKMYRFYILLVFLLYFGTILYTKIRQTRLRNIDQKAAQQLNVSIISFAGLWIFSIFEMISKTYLFGSNGSGILTEIFLSLGNLDQLSIIVMNYLTTKETMKKYNLVEPQA